MKTWRTAAFFVAFPVVWACPPGNTQPPATEWEKSLGGPGSDASSSVTQTSEGGYLAAGTTDSYGSGASDAFLLKVDKDGNELWFRTYGGPADDGAKAVRATSDGGIAMAGGTRSFGAGMEDVYLIKTRPDGLLDWYRTFGGDGDDQAYDIRETRDGGFVLTGWTSSSGAGNSDAFLVKTDASGNEIWASTFGGAGEEQGRSVEVMKDGSYLVAGYTQPPGAGEADVYVIRADPAGNAIWTRALGGTEIDWGRSIVESADGGIVVAGFTGSFGMGASDVYLLKMDVAGEVLWYRTLGGPEDDWGRSVAESRAGGYIVISTTLSYGAGREDVYVIRTDPEGNEIWSQTFGGRGSDFGDAIQETKDGGWILAGSTSSSGAGAEDVYLIKLAPEATSFLRADSSPDGSLNVTDAICTLTYLFRPSGALCETAIQLCQDAADANDDGRLNVADVVLILRVLFLGDSLPDPFGGCAPDLTSDELGCASFDPCR